MTRTPNPNPKDNVLDLLLDEHLAGPSEQIEPSSGFAQSVMESVQSHATAPPPIAFPWRRVLPGMLAVLCGLFAFVVLVLRAGSASSHLRADTPSPSPDFAHFLTAGVPAFTAGQVALCWILAAACLSVAAVAASFRLTGRSR